MHPAHHLEIEPHHLHGNGAVGRYVLLPGSAGRAATIGGRLDGATVVENRRGLTIHLGAFAGIDVAAVPTGMGCPSVDIVVNELIAQGARRLLRVGTSGALQPQIGVGDLVVATGALRDESASDAYSPPGFPAVADPWMVLALTRAAVALDLQDHVHCGILHSKDAFYGREFARGPDADRNAAYMERLARMGIVASEMEAAHLFVLASTLVRGPTTVAALGKGTAPMRAGALCAVIGTVAGGIATLAEEQAAEARLIDVALRGVVELAALEGDGA